MRLFDPLKKILVFFLLNAIAFVKADPNPPKLSRICVSSLITSPSYSDI